jgi:hypothetical protein
VRALCVCKEEGTAKQYINTSMGNACLHFISNQSATISEKRQRIHVQHQTNIVFIHFDKKLTALKLQEWKSLDWYITDEIVRSAM